MEAISHEAKQHEVGRKIYSAEVGDTTSTVLTLEIMRRMCRLCHTL